MLLPHPIFDSSDVSMVVKLTLCTRMSPDNTHKLMGFYMEVIILGVNAMYMLFCFSVSYRVNCVIMSYNRCCFSNPWCPRLYEELTCTNVIYYDRLRFTLNITQTYKARICRLAAAIIVTHSYPPPHGTFTDCLYKPINSTVSSTETIHGLNTSKNI